MLSGIFKEFIPEFCFVNSARITLQSFSGIDPGFHSVTISVILPPISPVDALGDFSKFSTGVLLRKYT